MLWLILGILIGFGLFWVVSRVKSKQLTVRWYQWLLGALSVILVLLAIENYVDLMAELEPVAAGFSWVLFGIPALVLAVLVWVIPKVGKAVKSRAGGQGVKA